MKKILLLTLAATALARAQETEKPTATATATATAKAAGVWIDVRTAEEFAAGHIEGAVNIPVEDIVAGVEKLQLKKDEPINLYCKLGVRAQRAYDALSAAGYSNLSNQGGYEELVAKGIK